MIQPSMDLPDVGWTVPDFSCGIGEPSSTPPIAPAIADAVYNTVVTRIFDFHITAEKVPGALTRLKKREFRCKKK